MHENEFSLKTRMLIVFINKCSTLTKQNSKLDAPISCTRHVNCYLDIR